MATHHVVVASCPAVCSSCAVCALPSVLAWRVQLWDKDFGPGANDRVGTFFVRFNNVNHRVGRECGYLGKWEPCLTSPSLCSLSSSR